jgi:DNA-binding PadR family transcriptional regulator
VRGGLLLVVTVARAERVKMAQTEQHDELAKIAARFAAMPAFPIAVREYTVSLMRLRGSPRPLNRLTSHNARWRVAAYLTYLHADRERYGPEGGATYSNLLAMCGPRAEISPRVLKTVLALLQLTGFVKSVRSQADRRSKIYKPTERMADFMQRWMEYATKALDILEPDIGRSKMLRDDPGFCDRFLVSSGRGHVTAVDLVEHMPEYMAFFGSRDGAGAVLLAVLLADIDKTAVPSRAELAKQFGFSKTQITKVFSDGEALGYFILDGAGAPAPTQRLRDSSNKWISLELAFYAMHMRAS